MGPGYYAVYNGGGGWSIIGIMLAEYEAAGGTGSDEYGAEGVAYGG